MEEIGLWQKKGTRREQAACDWIAGRNGTQHAGTARWSEKKTTISTLPAKQKCLVFYLFGFQVVIMSMKVVGNWMPMK